MGEGARRVAVASSTGVGGGGGVVVGVEVGGSGAGDKVAVAVGDGRRVAIGAGVGVRLGAADSRSINGTEGGGKTPPKANNCSGSLALTRMLSHWERATRPNKKMPTTKSICPPNFIGLCATLNELRASANFPPLPARARSPEISARWT